MYLHEHSLRKICFALFPMAELLCLTMLVGCSFYKNAPSDSGVPSSRVFSVSRVYLPASGGQTIVPPQKMADVTSLWMPLSRQELRLIARQRAKHPKIYSETISAATGSRWFEADWEIAEDYLFRLTQSQPRLTGYVLARAEAFLPDIFAALHANGLPRELAALPFVESAFEPMAVSPAGAAGLWQLMPATARRFGLVVTDAYDERLDPQKSTNAALQYLKYLYEYFQDWPIAVAAYNCGEGTMRRVLIECNASTFSSLASYCRNRSGDKAALSEETLSFVPKFIAAVAVMTNSHSYGLVERNLLGTGAFPLAFSCINLYKNIYSTNPRSIYGSTSTDD
jgi:membrane-bound lytic murein transglycosylase D